MGQALWATSFLQKYKSQTRENRSSSYFKSFLILKRRKIIDELKFILSCFSGDSRPRLVPLFVEPGDVKIWLEKANKQELENEKRTRSMAVWTQQLDMPPSVSRYNRKSTVKRDTFTDYKERLWENQVF